MQVRSKLSSFLENEAGQTGSFMNTFGSFSLTSLAGEQNMITYAVPKSIYERPVYIPCFLCGMQRMRAPWLCQFAERGQTQENITFFFLVKPNKYIIWHAERCQRNSLQMYIASWYWHIKLTVILVSCEIYHAIYFTYTYSSTYDVDYLAATHKPSHLSFRLSAHIIFSLFSFTLQAVCAKLFKNLAHWRMHRFAR